MNDRLGETREHSAAHPRRHSGAGRPVGWVTAHRLVDDKPVGPGADGLLALLASAAAPPTAAECSQASLNRVLDAYRQAVISPTPSVAERAVAGSPGHRAQRRVGRAMVVKFTGVLLVAAGTGAAAAGTDMLPASIQRVAHHYFGGLGVPAPSPDPGSPSAQAGTSPTPREIGSATPPASTTPISELIALCGEIPRGVKNWRTGLDAADQATLIAAAGADQNVTPYCAQLLANAGSATPSTTATGSDSSNGNGSNSGNGSPGASPTKSRSGSHDAHSATPNPHPSTGQ